MAFVDDSLHIHDRDCDKLKAFPEFHEVDKAACYILGNLPHEKSVFMVVGIDGVKAMVYQGTVYTPEDYSMYDED